MVLGEGRGEKGEERVKLLLGRSRSRGDDHGGGDARQHCGEQRLHQQRILFLLLLFLSLSSSLLPSLITFR